MSFIFKTFVVFILISLFSFCDFKNDSITKKGKHATCLDEISLKISGINFLITKKDSILYTSQASKRRDFLFLLDTTQQMIFTTYGHEILLVDCPNDTVYIHENLIPHWTHLAMSNLDTIENYFIFHNYGEFLLFDDKLNLQYSHRNFVDSLFKSGNIGFEVLMVDNYTKKEKFIEVTYLLELSPYSYDTIIETINLPTKIIND